MKIHRLITVLVLALAALPASATDWYVAGYAQWRSASTVGSDANDGLTSATPKATFASLDSLISAGDTVYVRGVHFGAVANPFAVVGKHNISIRQWPGVTQAHLHAGTRAQLTGWTQSSNRYARGGVGSSLVIGGVSWNYNTSQDANGMRRAWLKKVADAATCSSTNWSWAYDSATGGGTLYINTAGTGSPNSSPNVVTYVVVAAGGATAANLNGLYFQDCSGITIDGLEVSGYVGVVDSTSYYCNNIQLHGCTGSIVSNCTTWDGGIHSVVFAGAACTNNTMLNLACYGLNSRQGTADDGGSHFTFYSGNGNVTGCLGSRCTAVCSHLLDPTGTELNTSANTGGFYCHTSGTDNFGVGSTPIYVRGVLWDRPTLIALDHTCEPGFGSGNQPSPPTATPDRWDSYPVRIQDGRISGARILLADPVAFTRTRFDMTPVAADPNDTTIMTVAGISGYSLRLFTACDFIYHAAVDDNKLFATANNWVDRFVSCSFLIDRSAAVTFREFIGWNGSSTGQVYATNCIFADNNATGSTYLCVNDGSAAADRHVFRHNSYFNIDEYSANAALNTKAEWLGSVDTAATDDAATVKRHFPAALPFADTDGPLLDLAATAPLRRWISPYGPIRPAGINKRVWSGHLGSWQYPALEAK